MNSFKRIFGDNIGVKVDIKSTSIRSRKGEIVCAYNDFVLIDFEHLSSFCQGGLFYVCYRHIVDFQLVNGKSPKETKASNTIK